MNGLGERLHSAPFIRFLIPFISGIILAELLLLQRSLFYYTIPITGTLLLIFLKRNSYHYDLASGLIITWILLTLGFSVATNHRYIPEKLNSGRYYAFLDEYPIEKGKSYRALIRLNDPKIKVLAYFEKSDELSRAEPGILLFFKGYPELIENYGNPFEFDYKGYSLRKKIGHRIYLNSNAYHLLPNVKIPNLQNKAIVLRENLLKRLEENGVKGETFHVISAITLGSRDNLDPETTESFTRTGTIHVLAVSGGNVAVIFILLNFVAGFLKKTKVGVVAHTLIILAGIWGYALITGLSPSVQRAAVMFSFVVVGNNFSSKPNVYNSLSASAFILLLLNPDLLFDVGFQLSYAAVTAIVFFHPIFYRTVQSGYKLIDLVWLLFTVSLAAQIGTLPFSLYYFHQFPSYFWLSNMIVVPLVAVLIYFTLFVIIILPLLPYLGILAARLLNWIGEEMLVFLRFVEKLPYAVIENIYPTAIEMTLIIAAVTMSLIFIWNKKGKTAISALSIAVSFLIIINIATYKTLSRKEIIVFNIPGKTLIAFTHGIETTWLTGDKTESLRDLNYFIKPYEGFRKIKIHHHFAASDDVLQANEDLILNENFIWFMGLKIYLDQKNRPIYPSLCGFPEPDIVFISGTPEKLNSEMLLRFPKTLFITHSTLKYETGDVTGKIFYIKGVKIKANIISKL